MKNTLVIYHGNCADGFTAAWAVRQALGDTAEYYPATYQDAPPDVTGKHVVLVDFSYKRPVLLELAKVAASILVLDHHKTAEADLRDIETVVSDICPIRVVFDMQRSGARIAWDFYHEGKPVPRLVAYVEDRDLWRFQLDRSREINAWVFSNEYDFELWDKMARYLEDDPLGAVVQGMAIERKHHKDVAELVAALKHRMTIAGTEVWAANLPYTYSSDAGHLMAKGEPFAACYWDTGAGRVFSLRSADDGVDVSEVAKRYGGGGHARAAGFRLAPGTTL